MPIKKCSDGGKSGFKWGDSGKCYTGPDGKKKAIKQGLVIEGPEKFSQKAHKERIDFSPEDIDVVVDFLNEKNYSLAAITAVVALLKTEGVTKYIYEDPQTGERFVFTRLGNHKKNGRLLLYKGLA